jgi:hypothetical protein
LKAIHAIWKDGRIVPTQPVEWPEGTPLSVEPVGGPRGGDPDEGLLGGDPAAIARWIAVYDALPPLRMTEVEEEAWRAARRDVKDQTLARMRTLTIEDQP